MRGRGYLRGSGSSRGMGSNYRTSNSYGTNRNQSSSRQDRYNSNYGNTSNRYHSNNYGGDHNTGHYESRSRDKYNHTSRSLNRYNDSSYKRHYPSSSRDRSMDRKRSRDNDYRRTSTGARGNRTPPPPPPPIQTITSSSSTGNYRSYTSSSSHRANTSRNDHRNEDINNSRHRGTHMKRTTTVRTNYITRVGSNLASPGRGARTTYRGVHTGRLIRRDPTDLRQMRRLQAIKLARRHTSFIRNRHLSRRSKSPRKSINKKSSSDDEVEDNDKEEDNSKDEDAGSETKKMSSSAKKRRSSSSKRQKSSDKETTKTDNEEREYERAENDDNEDNEITASAVPTIIGENGDISDEKTNDTSIDAVCKEITNNDKSKPKEKYKEEKAKKDNSKSDGKKKSKEETSSDKKVKTKTSSTVTSKKRERRDTSDNDLESNDKKTVRTSRREDIRKGPRFIELTCVHCRARCVTFKEYLYHLNSRSHKHALRQIAFRQKAHLLRLRASQRNTQREIEENSKESYESKFCHLCRLHYRQPKAKHQLSEHHKTMKKFLMPYCSTCHLAFKSPMLYETHRCSLDHIRNKARNNDCDSSEHSGEDESGEIDLKKFLTVDSVGEIDDIDMDIDALLVASETPEETSENKNGDGENSPVKTSPPLGGQFVQKVEAVYCDLCKQYYPHPENMEEFTKKHCLQRIHLKAFIRFKDEERIREKEQNNDNDEEHDEETNGEDNDNKQEKQSNEEDKDNTDKTQIDAKDLDNSESMKEKEDESGKNCNLINEKSNSKLKNVGKARDEKQDNIQIEVAAGVENEIKFDGVAKNENGEANTNTLFEESKDFDSTDEQDETATVNMMDEEHSKDKIWDEGDESFEYLGCGMSNEEDDEGVLNIDIESEKAKSKELNGKKEEVKLEKEIKREIKEEPITPPKSKPQRRSLLGSKKADTSKKVA